MAEFKRRHTRSQKMSKMNASQSESDLPAAADTAPDGVFTPQMVTDLIKMFKTDIMDLRNTVSELVTENCELKTELGILQERLLIAEGLIIQAQSKALQQAEQITDLKCRSMRENIVVNGITEDNDEDWKKSEQKIKTFLKDDLKIDNVDELEIDRAHRSGQKIVGKPRPIIVKFLASSSKEKVFKNVKNLKGKNHLSVKEQLPPEVNECRKRLWPKYKAAKADQKNKVSWSTDKLIINGVSFSAKEENLEIKPSEIANMDIDVCHSEHNTIQDSTFMGHCAEIESKDDIQAVIANLLKDRAVAGATHNMYAYRFKSQNGQVIEGSKDDGEHGAGYNLLKLLRDRDDTNKMVVVTRWFGKTHLGPRRFEIIKNCAEETLKLLDP